MKILILEPIPLYAQMIHSVVQKELGFDVNTICDTSLNPESVKCDAYDLLILDIPELDTASDYARKMRHKYSDISILMISNAFTPKERSIALNAGADYVLSHPLDTQELLASIRAVSRRRPPKKARLGYGNTTLDLLSCKILCNGERVSLSAREFEVFKLLMTGKDQIVSKEDILRHVWDNPNLSNNLVEVYVALLRKKLVEVGSNLQIVSSRRLGYHLEVIE